MRVLTPLTTLFWVKQKGRQLLPKQPLTSGQGAPPSSPCGKKGLPCLRTYEAASWSSRPGGQRELAGHR